MLKKTISLIMMASLTLTMSAQHKESATDTLVVTTTPQMHCSSCESKIKGNIRFVKGTKKIETSVPDQEVRIIYDKRKAKPEDYIKAFGKIGYEIKIKKGNA